MGELLSLLFEMREILSLLPLFSTKSLKTTEIPTLLGEVCKIANLLSLERGLRVQGRSLGGTWTQPWRLAQHRVTSII